MGPMTRVVGPIVVLLLSLAGCGDAPPTVVPASPSCTCYAWEGPSEGSSLRVDDFGAWVKLAIHADGTYEVYHSGIQGYGGYDSGRWAAKDGKITFVPDMWSSVPEPVTSPPRAIWRDKVRFRFISIKQRISILIK